MSSKPKTGEKRKTRQPLKMDKLPSHLLDRVMAERSVGRTWEEIEDLSPRFEEWQKTEDVVRANFPGLRLPHSTLQRWYDIRVEQVKKEMLADAEKARELAATFSSRGIDGLPDAVMNALRDQIFVLLQSSDAGSRAKVVQGLGSLGLMISRIERTKVAQRKLDIEEEKIAAQKERLRDIGDPRDLYLGVALDVLKKLRSRKEVRSVIDPIREELVQEFSHGAEAYAKQIEAGQA